MTTIQVAVYTFRGIKNEIPHLSSIIVLGKCVITSGEVIETQSVIHRRERLIISAIDIMDELGLQKLSTREIARRENVTEATLFKHFKSKNELLKAVLDQFSKFDNDLYKSTKLKALNPIDAIIYLISSFVEYYDNYPAITSILQLFDVLRFEHGLTEKINEIFHSRASFIKQLVEEAQHDGDIRDDINSESLSDMLLGFCRETSLRQRLEGHKFSLKERVIPTVKITLDSYCQR